MASFYPTTSTSSSSGFFPESSTSISYESLQSMPLLQLLSLLLQPSPCDEKIDMLVDTLVNGEATATDNDPNRSVRTILLDHLVQLRSERRQMQANIETYVKVLQQVNEDEKEAKRMRDFYEKNKPTSESGGTGQSVTASDNGANFAFVAPSSDVMFDPQKHVTSGESTKKADENSKKDLKDMSKEEILQVLQKVMHQKKSKKRRRHRRDSSSSNSSRSSSSSDDEKRKHKSRKSRDKTRSKEKSVKPSKERTPAAPPGAYFDFYSQGPPPPNFSVPPPPVTMYPPGSLYNPPVVGGWPGMVPPPNSLYAHPKTGPPPMTSSIQTRQKLPTVPPAGTKLSDLRSMYAKCAKEEKWSKFLESSIRNDANEEELAMVFNELISVDSLIADHNACYVIKALFEVGNAGQKSQIVQRLKMQFKNVVATVYGSDFILSVVEKLGESAALELVPEMRTMVVSTSKNQNGVKILEKFIELLPSDEIKFFAEEIWEAGIFNLSRHVTSSRVIDAVIRKFDAEHKAKLLRDLLMFVEQMIVDQNASSVIRAALEFSPLEIRRQIIKILSDDFVNLSQHKDATHTIQKAIGLATREEISAILNSLLANYSSNSTDKFPLMDLMLDKFGCFVVIRLLDRLEEMDPLENTRLMHFIQPHLPYLEKIPRCKRIVAKYYKHCSTNYPPSMPPPPAPVGQPSGRQPLIQQYFP